MLAAQSVYMAGFGGLNVKVTQRYSKVYIIVLVLIVKTLTSIKFYGNSRAKFNNKNQLQPNKYSSEATHG